MTQQDTQPPAETLAECPFCGGSAQLMGFNAPEFWVSCLRIGCKAGTESFGSKERAVAAWNRRTSPALTRRAGGDAIPEGWQLVPIALPDEMAIAGAKGRQNSAISSFRDGWKYALAATPKPPAGGDAQTKGWDHRYRPLAWGEVILDTDECRRDDGTWVTGICVGQKAPDPAYTSHRVYRRLVAPAGGDAGAVEPFGYWVEQKHADPVLLRKHAYIPEPSDLRTVTPLYSAALALPAPVVEGWQPIETASRDCITEIDMWCASAEANGEGWNLRGILMVDTPDWIKREDGSDYFPHENGGFLTHWRPVPAPPTATPAALSEGRSHG